MLHEFLTIHRSELIDRRRNKVLKRSSRKATERQLTFGVPMFLNQLTETLRLEQTEYPQRSRRVSGAAGGEEGLSVIGETAARHGEELLASGYTVEQVVHDYGDLCQAITDLAFDLAEPIDIDEFRTLNRCLDNGIAVAVTEFIYQRDFGAAELQADAANQRIGAFAHELRNSLNSAMLALTAIKAGNMSLSGATGAVLERSLIGLRNQIDRSLADTRDKAGIAPQHQLCSLSDLIVEVGQSALLDAEARGCSLIIAPVDATLAVDADRSLLQAAIGNLLQNAFKFTKPGTEVRLEAYAKADRILIDVADKCGGLPEGFAEKMFLPFTQAAEDQTGVGLGLSISRRSVEASEGTLTARDLPCSGCVFTINLPRRSMEVTPDIADLPAEEDPFRLVTLSPKARGLSVLIAEDSSINRKLMERIFECLSMQPPVMVKDGRLAASLAATGSFDIVLMDCHMPILDGYESARKIRDAERKSNPSRRAHIIALTANTLPGERETALEAGMDDFLSKPLSLPLLAEVVERVAASQGISSTFRNDNP